VHKNTNVIILQHIPTKSAHASSKTLQYTGCSLHQHASDYVTTGLLPILHELTASTIDVCAGQQSDLKIHIVLVSGEGIWALYRMWALYGMASESDCTDPFCIECAEQVQLYCKML